MEDTDTRELFRRAKDAEVNLGRMDERILNMDRTLKEIMGRFDTLDKAVQDLRSRQAYYMGGMAVIVFLIQILFKR